MVCHLSSTHWFYDPTKEHNVIGEIDEEGHKIFEAFYGIPVKPLPPAFTMLFKYDPTKTSVEGVTKEDETTAYAEFAVDQYNKKRENQPSLHFLRVVGAVRIGLSLQENHFLITLQALDEPTKMEPTPMKTQPKSRKFFAKVSVYQCLHCRIKHPELVEWLLVDDDLTQLKHPLYKLRKEEKKFLKEMAAIFEREKQKFVQKIDGALGHMVQPEDKGPILKVILDDLERAMQFKDQYELRLLKFEAEPAYAILPTEPKIGESSELPAVRKVSDGVQTTLKERSPNKESPASLFVAMNFGDREWPAPRECHTWEPLFPCNVQI